ncbi:MAG: pilus assembly protein [Euzebyales bacterium]|nr:pilus assembly protein [Euzebyales bacterium]
MLPILVLLISGLVEFGMAYTTRLSLTHGAREGVRVYSLVDGGDWSTATVDGTGLSSSGGVTASNSGNCPTPSNPPNPAVPAWVEARRDNYPIRIAFIPAMTVNLRGRAVMRCGG